jgi:hypothetical protein
MMASIVEMVLLQVFKGVGQESNSKFSTPRKRAVRAGQRLAARKISS